MNSYLYMRNGEIEYGMQTDIGKRGQCMQSPIKSTCETKPEDRTS